jgi:phage tail-like protein
MRRQAIERLLPQAYQRAASPGGVLAAVLEAMEAMHEPTEVLLARVEDLFTPYRSPDRMVPFLLGWLAYDHILDQHEASGQRPGAAPPPAVPVGRLRDLIASGAALARRRGTAAGLRDLVETITGLPVTVEESASRPFHVLVRLPAEAAPQLALIRRVVEAEKPAATTCDVGIE